MTSIQNWISAFRLRTLFLAAATVVAGSGLALHEGRFSATVFLLSLLLAVSIQILANLANDLGDFQKGTDTTGRRQGPTRALQSGKISPREMKRAIAAVLTVCIVAGLSLVINIPLPAAAALIGLGAISLLAALFYTLGRHAYGYKGWGDLAAFIFFGPVPVAGVYFLHTHALDFRPLLPSAGIGLISAMILNINNMRDAENDRASGKHTLAVKLGARRAKLYHAGLTLASFLCFLGYNVLYEPLWYRNLYLPVFLLLFKILDDVRRKSGQALDPCLKLTALSGFLLAIAFAACINL
jgi:1,4-dihydroxy-2-naphthoate octaprenyltransferase